MNRIEGGIRLSRNPVHFDRATGPVISVITVVYNNKIFLEKTVKSVVSQTYPNIEYIIIDGNSTDGTLDIIRAYEDKIAYWLSEKDNGIYDAMNKGLECSTGDYVWFINSGDQIIEPATLHDMIKNDPALDVYYGDAVLIDKNDNILGMLRQRPPKKLTWKSLGMGMTVCHQALIIRRSLTGNYNLNYRVAADYDWVLTALRRSTEVCNTNAVLIKYLGDGFAQHNLMKSLKERFSIMRKNFGLARTLINHLFIIFRLFRFFIKEKNPRFYQ